MAEQDDNQARQGPTETFRQALFRYAMCVGVPVLFTAAAAILFLLPRLVPLSSWVCILVAAGAILVALALHGRRERLRFKLLLATSEGDEEKVKQLLASGASVKSGKGPNALLMAASEGHEGIVKLLLEARAEANPEAPEFGLSPLLTAVLQRRLGIVKMLLAAGADPNARVGTPELSPGATVFHCACVSASREIVEMLLAAGADASAKDERGWTPLDVAKAGDREDIVELLAAAGAGE